jgi:hypothetical protein
MDSMLNLEDARARAMELILKYYDLSSLGDTVEIVDSKTRQFTKGWVFFYNSALFHRTGDFKHMLMGNKPIFVNRKTGEAKHVHPTGSIDDLLRKLESE